MDNVVFHPSLPHVIGILDWELTTIGHPLSDLANMLTQFYSTVEPILGVSSGDFDGIPTAEELVQYYCREMNRTFPIPNWDFCVAFSYFRVQKKNIYQKRGTY